MNVCYNCVIWCNMGAHYPAAVNSYNCGIWGNMGAHHPAELSLSLVTYGLRLEVYDEARPKHWTTSVDPVDAG